MEKIEFNWQSSGKPVYGNIFRGETTPDKVLIFVHGIGEHIGRYDAWFEKFTQKGFAIVCADHHGHGKSAGKRGHFKNYCEPLDFVSMLFEKADEHFPSLPKILYGHSMGGNISLNYLLRKQPRVKGAIISSPWIKLQRPPAPWLITLAEWLHPVFPAFSLHTGIKREQLTANVSELKAIKKDELIHGRITLSTFLALNGASEYVKRNIGKLHVPMLLLHGTDDQIVNYEGAKELHHKNERLIQLELFEGFKHELHKEEHRDKLFDIINNWLEQFV
ncbi:MAG: lysophospholipase [Salinivirgaceae bacterium]|jgi:acylglycerol lipase|nr:lysophospholipase [Salinivirgaceae bacterium]